MIVRQPEALNSNQLANKLLFIGLGFVCVKTEMKGFIFALSVLAGLIYSLYHQRNADQRLSRLSLQGAIRVQFDQFNDSADFFKLESTDLKKVDSDLIRHNLSRVSPAFASTHGKYIITFARTSDEIIKRVLFIDGKLKADDVTEITKNRIATTSGEIQSISGITIED